MKLLLDFVLVVGIVINLIILSLLVKEKHKTLPHKILICFFLTILLVCLSDYAFLHKLRWLHLPTLIPDSISIWVIAPLLYIYIKSLFDISDNFIKKHSFHFIPAFLFLVFFSIPLLISSIQKDYLFEYLRWLLQDKGDSILIMLSDLYLLVYSLFSLSLFYDYKTILKRNYSSLSTYDFLWIQQMLLGSSIVIFLDVLTEVLYFFFGVTFPGIDNSGGDLVVIAMIFFVGYLGYYGIHQSKILIPNFLLPKEEEKNKPTTKKSTSGTFSNEEIKDLRFRLTETLEKEKPYLDEDLTLTKLAECIGISDKKLSTFLNQEIGTTFYDLINTARVEAVKQRIESKAYQQLTLLGIAYECGFKSKSSFNRIFKNVTGVSPSTYRNAIKLEE